MEFEKPISRLYSGTLEENLARFESNFDGVHPCTEESAFSPTGEEYRAYCLGFKVLSGEPAPMNMERALIDSWFQCVSDGTKSDGDQLYWREKPTITRSIYESDPKFDAVEMYGRLLVSEHKASA